MALINDNDNIEEASKKEDRLQNSLKVDFVKRLNSNLNVISNSIIDNKFNIANDGNINKYLQLLGTTLFINYQKIGNKFKDTIRSKLNFSNNEVTSKVNLNLQFYFQEQTREITPKLLKTTNERVENTIKLLQESDISNDELIKQAKQLLLLQNNLRSVTIADTETNKIAENSKHTEAIALVSSVGFLVRLKKRWDSTLDGKTREGHARADGQLASLNQPFVVDGESLMYPSDISLGASLANVINCRCKTHYISSL